MRKIAIIVGHNARARGAVRVTDGATEYEWNGELAARIKAMNPHQVKVFRRAPAASAGAEIRACYAEVDAWCADVSCELHFNAAASPAATGTETLWATSAGKAVADRVQAAMVRALGLRDRGLLERRTGNGSQSLIAGRAPAVLVEPYFGSNAGDCRRADERCDALARAIFVALGGDELVSEAPPGREEDKGGAMPNETTIPSFNPSGSEVVAEIKRRTEELMDYLREAVPDNRCRAIALTNYEQAAMWAVKANFI